MTPHLGEEAAGDSISTVCFEAKVASDVEDLQHAERHKTYPTPSREASAPKRGAVGPAWLRGRAWSAAPNAGTCCDGAVVCWVQVWASALRRNNVALLHTSLWTVGG